MIHSTLRTSHFALHTSHSTSHDTHHTPHFTLHTSHCARHTPHFTLDTPHFTFHMLQSTSQSHACHATYTFTLCKTSPFLTFPIGSATVRWESRNAKTVHKQFTTARPRRKKARTFRYVREKMLRQRNMRSNCLSLACRARWPWCSRYHRAAPCSSSVTGGTTFWCSNACKTGWSTFQCSRLNVSHT